MVPKRMLLAWICLLSATVNSKAQASNSPRYAKVAGRIETLWQRPREGVPIRGILFMAHGCMHQGTDFFADYGHDGWQFVECSKSNFGRCLGLPEERLIAQAGRERGYLVLAVSGGSGRQSCWNMRADPNRVRQAIRYVLKEEGLSADTTVFATGASSGGAFLGALTESQVLHPHLRCIAPQISGIQVGERSAAVPTIFIHMPRDKGTAQHVHWNIEELQAFGVRVEEIKVHPTPVSRELLMRGMSEDSAALVVDALRSAGFTEQEGFLKSEPRMSHWRQSFKKAAPKNDSLVGDESALSELLNVAWASHEMTSQYIHRILDFCESELGAGSTKDEL